MLRVGDIVKFKYDGGEVLIGRVNSEGTTYDKPFHTKCETIYLIYFVKVLGHSTEFIVKPEDIIEVFITAEVVQFS